MALSIITFAAVILNLVLLIPIRLSFDLRIRTIGAFFRIKAFLFGAIPVELRIRTVYRPPDGLVLFIGSGKGVVIGERRPKNRFGLFKAVRLVKLNVTGSVGIKERPDISVMLAGALGAALSGAGTAVSETVPEVGVMPSFARDAFYLNARGIVLVKAGRLIIEEFKLKRREKNESSNRKHNAFVNGARKEAC